ncbi:MerR family transcriptional regulator [Bacillus xiapuensis]|uniref:MerR family transcriptional regulator n=1 Tax=Bacillus xiapuensis TaxID=2014075 RepID=UPI000C24D468|nr:MerR family transcriptional regulator [Bacillus xiapuensis]
MNDGKYNIKAVSNIVGIQPGTLRAWERRYQILDPVRNESGHRLYTEEDVQLLKGLTAKVSQGFTISQAISLMDSRDMEREKAENEQQALSEGLLQALLAFNERKAQEYINQAFSFYTMDKVTDDLLAGAVGRIEDMLNEGTITAAHEHFALSILHTRIKMIMHSLTYNSMLPKVMAVCGPGEQHETDGMLFTLFVRRRGYEVVYLGSGLKESDLKAALRTAAPKYLFFSVTRAENLAETVEWIHHLKEEWRNLEIGIGGKAVNTLKDRSEFIIKAKPFIIGNSGEEWERWLNEGK